MNFWASSLVADGEELSSVRFIVASGRILKRLAGSPPEPEDVLLGTVMPGMGNAHSHAFHRLLRGHTHRNAGDFWAWRERMYAAAASLDPAGYRAVARAVFAEMLVCGYTAVGEFHYLHHRQDGTPYEAEHAMELALAEAATEVGIRLVLLDTCYLAGGIGVDLSLAQRAFGDGSAAAWLARWHSLRAALAGYDTVTLGAAVHSVRAVPEAAIAEILSGLPADVPLHIHVSEQPQENADALAAFGLTPTALLARLGALSPRLSLVHATHLTPEDIGLIAASGATVVFCPTTEADLGDGIGPARELADTGVVLALGSDQNAVLDPFLELRGLEAGERLASGQRGRFDPGELVRMGTANGYLSLGLGGNSLLPGDFCDLIEVNRASIRTAGADVLQLSLTATAADVQRVVVNGVMVAHNGRLAADDSAAFSRRPENLLLEAINRLAR